MRDYEVEELGVPRKWKMRATYFLTLVLYLGFLIMPRISSAKDISISCSVVIFIFI